VDVETDRSRDLNDPEPPSPNPASNPAPNPAQAPAPRPEQAPDEAQASAGGPLALWRGAEARRIDGPVIEHGARPRSRWSHSRTTKALAGVIGAVFLVLAGGGVWYFSPLGPNDRHPAPAASGAIAGATRPAPATVAEGGLWRGTDQRDPLALQKYLSLYPRGYYAAAARGALALLEGEAWATIETQEDADARLEALSAFAVQFAGGEHAQDAAALRVATLDMVEAIERALAVNGHDPGVIDGVIAPETQAAVERYRKATGLPGSHAINAALLAQLLATAPPQPTDALIEDAGAMAPGASRDPVNTQTSRGLSGAGRAPSEAPRAAAPAVSPANATTGQAVTERAGPSAGSFRDCFVCPQMTPLPLGRAMIGDVSGAGDLDEKPAHLVAIGYRVAVGRFEVTNDEWAACVGEGGCARLPGTAAGGAFPVAGVNWRDARQYVAWLSRKTSARYRLLSEAEWEYAARAGSQAAFFFGDAEAELCGYANHADAATAYAWRNRACTDGFVSSPAPVGSFRANAFGLHDMSGNVWEWVEDCWHPSYAGAPTDGAAWTTACVGLDRVLRGGAWSVRAANVRASYRYAFTPDLRAPYFGLRVARAMD